MKVNGKDYPIYYVYIYMVGGIPTPLKNMKVSWDDDIPNIWKKNQTTNLCIYIYIFYIIFYDVGPLSYKLVYKPH